jgi:hypothetical protein
MIGHMKSRVAFRVSAMASLGVGQYQGYCALFLMAGAGAGGLANACITMAWELMSGGFAGGCAGAGGFAGRPPRKFLALMYNSRHIN